MWQQRLRLLRTKWISRARIPRQGLPVHRKQNDIIILWHFRVKLLLERYGKNIYNCCWRYQVTLRQTKQWSKPCASSQQYKWHITLLHIVKSQSHQDSNTKSRRLSHLHTPPPATRCASRAYRCLASRCSSINLSGHLDGLTLSWGRSVWTSGWEFWASDPISVRTSGRVLCLLSRVLIPPANISITLMILQNTNCSRS